jgi:spore coat protein SA
LENRKIHLLIVCGTLENGMRPVPPVADGAPEWNVFRLAEAAFADSACSLKIDVISPCEESQLQALRDFPVKATGRYHHIILSHFLLDLHRKYLRHFGLFSILLRRLLKLSDLVSWVYLRSVLRYIKELKPDIVILNDRPQYIRYLRNRVMPGRLFLMVRYPMGESRRFLALLDGMIVNSAGMKEYVGQFIQPGRPAICQMPNTLGDEFVISKGAADRFARTEKVILFVGRLIAEKGARELLLAFQRIHKELPAVRLVICGVGSAAYQRELYSLAALLPPEAVTFQGYVAYHQLGEYYCRASVAVFPSLPGIYVESFGMVALEAMRCGTPVVAARQPGFEELVLPGKTGLLVDDPFDSKCLAQTILQILQDPALAGQMGQAGYLRSLEYTPESGLLALEGILKGVW